MDLRTVVVEAQRAVRLGDDHRRRQERLQNLLAGHRPRARTASAVRRGEGLVQVQVHHVGAEVAGTHLADQRVHVGAVHVEQRALGVQHVGNLVDLLLEDAQRIGIGEHQRGHVFVHLRLQRRHVHHAGGVRLQVLDRVAAHRRRRRIGAVRRVGDQDLLARIALRLADRRAPSGCRSARHARPPRAAR